MNVKTKAMTVTMKVELSVRTKMGPFIVNAPKVIRFTWTVHALTIMSANPTRHVKNMQFVKILTAIMIVSVFQESFLIYILGQYVKTYVKTYAKTYVKT